MSTRGFVTIATGNEKYYELAYNLLRSYKKYASEETPFALICDRHTSQTALFDQVIIVEEPNYSYMDKLLLYRYSPFDETIFIDADSLILADPQGLWKDFSDVDDVSCYGCTYPLDSDRAWFTYDGTGKYKSCIEYLVGLHGGVYFCRKTDRCVAIFETAIELAEHYHQYSFRHFEQPADEPVMAMSLAIHHSVPCARPMQLLFVPSYWGKLHVVASGQVYMGKAPLAAPILHFGTDNTKRFLYRYLVQALLRSSSASLGSQFTRYLSLRIRTAPTECKVIVAHTCGKILRKCLPEAVVNRIKQILK